MPDSLAALQEQFAAHIRNPELNPAPEDVEERRMAIYRDLFFRNLANFLKGNFPVLRSLYDDEGWATLVREFYTEHNCQTPLFPEISREFLQYLQNSRQDRAGDPPFMLELAHYEWVELALDLDEAELDDIEADADGDLLSGIPVLSPLAWPLSYRFPVQQIRPDFQPEEAPDEPTHLLVYRDRNDKVRFMQLNPVALKLILLLKEDRGVSGHELLSEVAEVLEHPQPQVVIDGGAALLNDLRNRDIVLGVQAKKP